MLMGLNLLSQPAQAISYNVSGNLADGGSVSGSGGVLNLWKRV
jgi:hypothetical protein